MRFIATTGYYGSGSSAVTDLLREYSSIYQSEGRDYEISFFFGYHGIQNLYYWIVLGKRLQNMAVQDYLNDAKRMASFGRKMNYEKYFQGRFMKSTYEYIKRIRGDKSGARYVVDVMKMSNAKFFLYRVANKFHSVSGQLYNKFHTDVRQSNTRLFHKKEQIYLFNTDKHTFIKETKKYFEDLFEGTNENKPIMVDGLIATHSLDDISMFFDDLRIIIVRRDPRDVYLSEKYIWHTDAVPRDVEDFCKWFKVRMGCFSYQKSSVLNIRFEDMIFDYENTVSKIEQFSGINSNTHIAKQKYFIPQVSMNNCRIWERYPKEEKNMKIIENELSEWIYPYADNPQ